jgi:hypothetical protein
MTNERQEDVRVAGTDATPEPKSGPPSGPPSGAPLGPPAGSPSGPPSGPPGPPPGPPPGQPGPPGPGPAHASGPGPAHKPGAGPSEPPSTIPDPPERETEQESEVATSFPPATPPTEEQGRPPAEPAPQPLERLIDIADADRFRERWSEVQSGFIDDPAEAVRRADDLAAEIVNALGQALAERKRSLDARQDDKDDQRNDTEQLRLTLRAYREFVDRMLAT